ncbi:MAG: OmpH family outer membrane protein [Thermaceae bacterium]|nr:OmpH family outer membrane protein [Thermaceae bacterium]
MKHSLFFVPVLAGLLLGGSLVAQNKNVPTKIGYIDAQKVVQAHPNYKNIKDLEAQAQAELKPLQDKLTPLQAKIQSGTATAKDQQDFQVLRQSYQEAAKKWTDRSQAALKPITEQIDKVITTVAQQQGFAMVFDKKVAASSGLVVYADPSLDLTDAVIKGLPK